MGSNPHDFLREGFLQRCFLELQRRACRNSLPLRQMALFEELIYASRAWFCDGVVVPLYRSHLLLLCLKMPRAKVTASEAH